MGGRGCNDEARDEARGVKLGLGVVSGDGLGNARAKG